ncbi:MAG: hypothetical protein IIU45_05265, partial [Lachnospiraceae bacterium]|nr:hypothetical protein [Lachnospiraceae bacterium]
IIQRRHSLAFNVLLTMALLFLALFLSLAIQSWFSGAQALIPAIFVLAVYLVSLATDGYLLVVM